MNDEFNLLQRRKSMVEQGLWQDKTLLDYFAQHVDARPEKEALYAPRSDTGADVRFTYGELDQISDRVAIGLIRCGVESGDVVSFQLPNWWQFTVLHLACLKVGAVSNPLMVIFRERELKFMLGLAETKVFVVPKIFRGVDHRALALNVAKEVSSLDHVFVVDGEGRENFETLIASDITNKEIATLRKRKLSPDAIIQLLYTSGTTGEPKGVCHSSNTMLANLIPFAERLHLGLGDVIHMPSPMAHQLGFMYGLVLPALLGAKAVLQDVFVAETMARQIVDEQATFTMGATPFLNDLADYCVSTSTQTSSLRIFVSAGAPIPRALVSKARDALDAQIISAWGMSENGAVTTTRPEDPEEKVTMTDGCPLRGMELQVMNAHGHRAAVDEEGALLVRGCSNFAGYLKRPGLAQMDSEGWFDTGDLAKMDAEGYIRIAGRSKDIIIRGGENIPVVEVEELLFKHPSIAVAAIVGYSDERLGERACAFVELVEGQLFSFEEMVAYLIEQKMAKQYIPERLIITQELPRTPSGKIQKFKLRDELKSGAENA